MRKFISGFIMAAIIFTGISAYAAQNILPNPFPIVVNGQQANIQAYNIDGSTFIKLSDVSNALGGVNVQFADNAIKIDSIQATTQQTTQPTAEQGVTTYEKDGVTVAKIDGVEYISRVEFNRIHKDHYALFDNSIKITKPLPKELNADNIKQYIDPPVLIKDIPTKYFNFDYHIEYDYYKNSILPLLE